MSEFTGDVYLGTRVGRRRAEGAYNSVFEKAKNAIRDVIKRDWEYGNRNVGQVTMPVPSTFGVEDYYEYRLQNRPDDRENQ